MGQVVMVLGARPPQMVEGQDWGCGGGVVNVTLSGMRKRDVS